MAQRPIGDDRRRRPAKRFVVAGHPRSGSTFLINRLALAVDAFTPQAPHEELFNIYECRFNCCVLGLDGSSERSILEGFFTKADKRFAGFKTIPSFHREWQSIAEASDVQFITIVRDDFLSCLASVLISERNFRWDQPAREQLGGERLWFEQIFPKRRDLEIRLGEMLNRLIFDYRSLERLNQHEATIALTCESLLPLNSRFERLDQYFEQPIDLSGFRRPSDWRELFHDAEAFRATTAALLHRFLEHDTFIPRALANFLASQ